MHNLTYADRANRSRGCVMTELFRQGYRDARMGEDFIREDMPLAYYEGVRKAMIEKEWTT